MRTLIEFYVETVKLAWGLNGGASFEKTEKRSLAFQMRGTAKEMVFL